MEQKIDKFLFPDFLLVICGFGFKGNGNGQYLFLVRKKIGLLNV